MKTVALLFLLLLASLLVVRVAGARAWQPAWREEVATDLLQKETPKFVGWNPLSWLIGAAVERGVSPTTIVFLLLLPVVATLVSALHYVIGLSGYGIYMPSMVAVGFLATGLYGGILLFAVILLISALGGAIFKKLRLHYWPSRSFNLAFISVSVFVLMAFSSYSNLFDISKISIFPILFMIILAEEFTKTQLVKSKHQAKTLLFGTIILAIIGATIMSSEVVQQFVYRKPELVLLAVVVINLWIGNYKGMRLMELKRFAGAIRRKS